MQVMCGGLCHSQRAVGLSGSGGRKDGHFNRLTATTRPNGRVQKVRHSDIWSTPGDGQDLKNHIRIHM